MIINDYHIIHSVDWLAKIQNIDGGWGMYDHDDSRIVTTAESITALAIAGVKDKVIDDGIEYLVKSGNNSNWCKYTRHHAWIIYALTRAGQKNKIPNRCFQFLQKYHVNGSWSHQSRGHPNLFATFLALRALNVSGKSKRIIELSRQWINQQSKGTHWSFEDNLPSYTATSYAILALTTQTNWYNSPYGKRVVDAVNFLQEGASSNWPIERTPNVSGDLLYNFHHCSLSWVIMAFLSSGVSPYEAIITKSLDQLYNKFYCDNTGGWSEDEYHRPSVFATSHAISALEMFYNSISIQNYLSSFLEGDSFMSNVQNKSNNIFIVHGHDSSVKYEISHFLERLGCNVIILDEQVESGLTTIFQKLTEYTENLSYAIVLLTPDDFAVDLTGNRFARARQNVIFELGLFIGKLGTEKVCLAKKGDVDIPTDISGVLYLDLDNEGWKLSLTQKLNKAGLSIDMSKL